MKIRNLMLVAALAMTTACFTTSAVAQGDILDQKISSADYQNSDVREVLKTLFKSVNANYNIAHDIQGFITLSMKDAKFELILQNVLSQVNATYRYEGGMFLIVKRGEQVIGDPTVDQTPVPKKDGKIIRKIYIKSADPALIALLLSGRQDYNGSPEITSLGRLSQGGFGGGFGGGGFGNGGFGNGGFGNGSGGNIGGGFQGGGNTGGGFGNRGTGNSGIGSSGFGSSGFGG